MDIGPRSTSLSLKYIYSGHVSRVSRVLLKLKHGYVLLSCVLHVRRKTYNWKHALLSLKALTYGFFSTQTSPIQFLHGTATSTTPTHTQNCPIADAVLFFGASLLPKRGRGGVGARAAAAAKMNSCRSCNSKKAQNWLEPVKVLYSESLTKSTKSKGNMGIFFSIRRLRAPQL